MFFVFASKTEASMQESYENETVQMWLKGCSGESDQMGAHHTKGWSLMPKSFPFPLHHIATVAGSDSLSVCECVHIPQCEYARTHTQIECAHDALRCASSAVCSDHTRSHTNTRVLPHTEMLSLSGERNTVTHFWQSGEQGTNTIMQFKFSSWMHAKPEGSWNGAPGSYSLLSPLWWKHTSKRFHIAQLL